MEEATISVPIGMTGEGSQGVLRLISELDPGSAIMAIEEPETHLHPGLIKQVGQLLTEATDKGKQLFVSTHSPFLVEQSSLISLFVVNKQGNATNVSRMSNIEGLRSLLLDIGMRPSDILFTDAILLVEGLSDEIFFTAVSKKIDAPLARHHVKIVSANGYPRGRRKIEFWAEVGRDAGIPLYLILDKNAREEADQAIQKEHIKEERVLILSEGNLEDCYPWDALRRALLATIDKEIEVPIPVGERVKKLKMLLQGKESGNQWKPELAEAISQTITRQEAESEMGEVTGFLRKIYHEVGID